MAKHAESVVAFDVTKYFGEFDKYVGDLKAPGFGFDFVVAMQRRNIEALAAANKLAAEAFQAVLQRQAEIVRQSVEEFSGVAGQFTAQGSLPEKAARQTELTKDVFERSLGNMRELSEMVVKSNIEACELLNKRFVESLDEMRDVLLKTGK